MSQNKSTLRWLILVLAAVILTPLLLCGGLFYLGYRYVNAELDRFTSQTIGVSCDGWYFSSGVYSDPGDPAVSGSLFLRETDGTTLKTAKTGKNKVFVRLNGQPPQLAREIKPADMQKLGMKGPRDEARDGTTCTIFESEDENLRFEFAGEELISIQVDTEFKLEIRQFIFCDAAGTREFTLPADMEQIVEAFGEANCEREHPKRW